MVDDTVEQMSTTANVQISFKDSIWPKVREELILPKGPREGLAAGLDAELKALLNKGPAGGLTKGEAWFTHSRPYLLTQWTDKWKQQMVCHRGFDSPAFAIVPGAHDALDIATGRLRDLDSK